MRKRVAGGNYKTLVEPLSASEKSAVVGLIAVGKTPTEACAILRLPLARHAKSLDKDKIYKSDVLAVSRCLMIESRDRIREMGMAGNLKALEDWMVNESRHLPTEDPHRWVNPNWVPIEDKGNVDDAKAYFNKVFEHMCQMDGVDVPPNSKVMPDDDDILENAPAVETQNPEKRPIDRLAR